MGVGAAWANIRSAKAASQAAAAMAAAAGVYHPRGWRDRCDRECDGGWSGDSSDWSRSRSDGRSGGKRRSPCTASCQRGTRGSGDWGLLLWRARREQDTRLLCNVIFVVL